MPENEAKSVFSKNLQELLNERGMTIYRLAAEAKIPQRRAYRAATGQFVPDVTTALAIARFFDVSVESLFSEKISKKTIDTRVNKR